MPHSNNLIDISVNAQTGAEPLETKLTLGILATATEANKPADVEFNKNYSCGSPEEVGRIFGEGSDAHLEAQAARQMRASNYQVVLAERTMQTETLAGTDETPSTSGTASTVPITGFGDEDVTVTVDGGASITATAVTSAPPKPIGQEGTPDATPAAGEAIYNADVGKFKTGDETAGSTSGGGITVKYPTVSYTDALAALAAASVDILLPGANERYDRSNVGDLDEITTWMGSYDVRAPFVYAKGTTLEGGAGPASVYAEQTLAQDVGAYSPSKYAFPITNSSTDHVAGAIAGLFSVNEPYFDPFQRDLDLNAGPRNRYTEGNIGVPELPGTFEGGDQGAGMSNVLFSDGSTKLSNSLTTAGVDSPYRYIDIAGAEAYIKAKARNAVSAIFGRDGFRFNEVGETMLKDALDDVLQPIAADDAFHFIDVDVPSASELSRQMRANRFWDGVIITVGFAPTAHRVGMEVRMTLATENPNVAAESEPVFGQTSAQA